MQLIPPLKTYNRIHPSPTKDEIRIWANQDDNYTWSKGYEIIKDTDIKRVKVKPIIS